MTLILTILLLSLSIGSVEPAQKHKSTRSRSKSSSTQQKGTGSANGPAARVIGSTVVITTKNGEQITGSLLDLNAFSARIRSGNLESTVALETVASISFKPVAARSPGQPPRTAPHRPDFARDVEAVLAAFQTMSSSTKPGVDYTEYGRQLIELRRAADRYIGKYAGSDDALESRTAALAASALTDYTWARNIWTLKLGYSASPAVSESDSPAVADALSLYPELRTTAASGPKFSADKLVAGLWKQASNKIDRMRSMTGQVR